MRGPGDIHPILGAFNESPIGATIQVTNTPQAFNYPDGATFIKIQATDKIYLSLDSTRAHIPAASINATTGSTGRQVLIKGNEDQFFQLSAKTTNDKFSVVSSSLLAVRTAIIHFYGTGA